MSSTTYLVTFLMGICVLKIDGAPITQESPAPWENINGPPGLVEGDIKPWLQSRSLRTVGASTSWPDGIIPYKIQAGFSISEQATIIKTMREMESLVAINSKKCIQFLPKKPWDQHYLFIQGSEIGCWSTVGYSSVFQKVTNLQPDWCAVTHTIKHELMHAIGFWHEHTRPDRDSYIRVNADNIQPEAERYFVKHGNTDSTTLDTSYDYKSILHYPSTVFSKNGLPTIEALQPNIEFGRSKTLSDIDIQGVRLFYGCAAETNPRTTSTSSGTPTSRTSTWAINLETSSPAFKRIGHFSDSFYYAALRIVASANGTYTLKSRSSIDTFACLYGGAFNPFDTNSNSD